MVRSIGIDPGDFAVKVVEIDGSYRKTRLLAVRTTVIAGEATVHAAAVAAAARAALDDGMRGPVTLGHPCREAVLRVIDLPFKGSDAIRKVVKAEIEGEIQTHSVDDMIVDFHEIGEAAEGGTRLLVASVPKPALRRQLEELTAVTIEPERVDLDTMALWRAAHWAGVFEVPEGEVDEAASAGSPRVTALVDIGARSVKVLLVEGERLVEMRVLRVGSEAIVDEIGRQLTLAPADLRDAVQQALQTGADVRLEVAEALPAATEGEGGEAAPAPRMQVVKLDHKVVEAANTGFLQRLSRELVRYLTSTGRSAKIHSVWTTGGASRSAGMAEMLEAVFGIAPQPLDLLGKLQHDLAPDEVEALGPQIATALGLALSPLGGPAGFELRQEDLVLSRGFERIKFPLAIVCMVAMLAVLVYGVSLATKVRHLELEIGRTHPPESPKDPLMFHGMLHSVLAGRWFEEPRYFRYEVSKGHEYGYKDLVDELDAAPVQKRILIVRDRLKKVVDDKQKKSGIYEDVKLESGFAVLVRWAELLKRVEPELGRYLVMKVDLNMDPRSRYLEFRIAFRGPDFRDRLSSLERAVDAEFAMPDTPFAKPSKESRSNDELFSDTATSNVPGSFYKIRMSIKDTFEPFGQGGNTLGAAPAVPRTEDRLAMEGPR